MEDDGVVGEPVNLKVRVTVDGDRLIVDWTGTDRQVRGPINATYGVTAGAVYNAIFHVTESDIPKNSGAYRPIDVIAPPGTVVNVQYPGPSVGGNTETHPKLADMVIGALGQVLPDKVAAAEGATCCNFLFGGTHPKSGEYFANYHLEGGGWGAKTYDDGNDATIVKNGNCRNTPVEVFETRFPLITAEYSLIEDSGGAGRMRGGLGTRRVMRIADGAEITVSALLDRTQPEFKPWGLEGGGSGGNAAILVKRAGEREFRSFREAFGTASASKFTNIRLVAGDEVLLDSPGGGGYGDPRERDREAVRRDVAEGLVSAAAAREIYGLEVAVMSGTMGADRDAGVGHRRDAVRLLRAGRRAAPVGRRRRRRGATLLRPRLRAALPLVRRAGARRGDGGGLRR